MTLHLPNIKKRLIGVGCAILLLSVLSYVWNDYSNQSLLDQIDISNATCIKMECRAFPSTSPIVTVFPLPKQLEGGDAQYIIAEDPTLLVMSMSSWLRSDVIFQAEPQEDFQWIYKFTYYIPPTSEETLYREVEVLVGETCSVVNGIPFLSSENPRFEGFYHYMQETFETYK